MSKHGEKNHKPQQTLKRGPMQGGAGGPMSALMPGEKARNFKGSITKLVRYLGEHRAMIVFVWILAIASTGFMIVGPKILGGATDEIFNGLMATIAGTGGINFERIAQIVLMLALLYVLSAVLSYVQGFIMTGITQKISYKLRKEISDKIHRLPFKYFDRVTQGEVLSRITNDVDTISQTLNQSLTQIITSATQLIGFMIMMLSISWQLTLVSIVILPTSAVFVMMIVKKSQKHFFNQQKYLGNVNGHVEEMFGAHTIVKAFNGAEDSTEKFCEHSDNLYNAAWKANFLSGLMMPITNFIGNVAYVAICILGGYFATQGSMTVGGIQAFINYVRNFTQPITQIANISNVLQQTAAAAERVFEFLGEEEEALDAERALSVKRKDTDGITVHGNVEIENVSFGYDPETAIIRDFSASVREGQKIAIVGPTGAGKTTIVKLLMRFYDIGSGAIKVDGHDITMFKRDELRSVFGMVLQDTWLFNGTIRENIRYGRLDATDDEVYAAAVAAQVDHFVRTMPNGYDMELNEEANNISQGQKQLMTIARAILKDPEILILDEATSSVDTRTEIMIQKAMDNLMQGRTSFVIAHRLSTIKNADLILVMDKGDIVEQGTHDELLARGGFYEKLYNSQFEDAS